MRRSQLTVRVMSKVTPAGDRFWLSTMIVGSLVVGVVVLLHPWARNAAPAEEVDYLPEEPDYALLEERYTALETRFSVLEARLEGCINALQRPLDTLQRPLGDAGDAREERVSGGDTVPLDASRAPRDPLVAGGYKWSPRVILDLETPERNPRGGRFGVSMTPNQDGISVEYEVGL